MIALGNGIGGMYASTDAMADSLTSAAKAAGALLGQGGGQGTKAGRVGPVLGCGEWS